MRIIKVIKDDGKATMVKVMREAHKQKKCLTEMTSEEIAKTCFGMMR